MVPATRPAGAKLTDVADELGLIRWEAPGPYRVAFTTRAGGVSAGPYDSLNLALMSDDEPQNVAENRRRLCAALGAEPERLAMNRQEHTTLVHRARAGARGEPGDGLWTDEPGVPMLKLTADCVPIAIARAAAGRPALALLHAGWRGLAEGIVAAGVAALGGGRLAAAVGPAIGPCCYEVGAGGRRSASTPTSRATACSTSGARASAPSAPPGVERGRAGRPLHPLQPGAVLLASPPGPDPRSAGCRRSRRLSRSACGSSGSAPRSGRASRSSPRRSTCPSRTWRCCSRRASRSRARTARRISRPSTPSTATRSAGTSSATCSRTRRRSSTASASSSTRSTRRRPPAGSRSRRSSRSNLAGEATKRGVPPEEIAELLALADVRGLSTMPPAAADPEASRPYFRRLRELAAAARPRGALDGHEPGLPRRRRGGRDLRPRGIRPVPGITSAAMSLGDLWNRTLVYFGIAEEDDDWIDEDGYPHDESLEQSYATGRTSAG